jgi:hypothetical protein
MHMLKITIAATNTPQPLIQKAVVPANSATFSVFLAQYNGTNLMYIGDAAITKTNSIILFPSGSMTVTPALQFTGDLTEFWLIGTANDVLNVMIFD